MNQFAQTVRFARRLLGTAALLSTLAAGAAFAGSCPADKIRRRRQGRSRCRPCRPQGVTDDVIATNDSRSRPSGSTTVCSACAAW